MIRHTKQNIIKSFLVALSISSVLAGCNANSQSTSESEADATATNSKTDTKNDSTQTSNDDVLNALQTNLKASGIEQTFTSAIPTDMPDIYWVTGEGSPSFYTDKEGKYVIQGQIVEIGGEQPVDISASLVAKSAKEKLAMVDQKELITYPAKGETKAVVYAFTDADCPYCTKLHSEMEEINNLGVEVRYLAWPRSEGSIPKMESIWCSDDRVAAMDKVKSGEIVTAKSCDSPVMSHINIGLILGVSGTPAIFTDSGIQIGGYLPPKQLADAAINNS